MRSGRSALLTVFSLVCLLASVAPAAAAEVAASGTIGSGPLLVGGYSGDRDAADRDADLYFAGVGWRWRRDGADFLDDFFAKGHVDFSWAVEPMLAGVFGHKDTVEFSVVPLFRLQPLGWEKVAPYFDAGIGLIYTGLDGYGLGSHFQFSDNAGIGLAFGSESGLRCAIGYRFRHISNAGIWGDSNDGLNAHFLVFAFE